MDIRQEWVRWPLSIAIALSLCLALTGLWPWFFAVRVRTSQTTSQPILIDLHLLDALPLVQTSAEPALISPVRPLPPAQRAARSARSRPDVRAAHVAHTLPVAAALDQPPITAARPMAEAQVMSNEAGPAAVDMNTTDQVTKTRMGTGDAEDEAKLRAAVNASLRHDLQRYFRYPPLARRMGWQGEVWLRFDMHDDGAIAAIQVARSSGYDLLDEDAVHTLQQVAHLTKAPPGRRLQGLEIPVIYRLTEG